METNKEPSPNIGRTGRLLTNYYVEYPPGGLWVGDCEIYPKTNNEYAVIHRCRNHIVLVNWGWAEVGDDSVAQAW